MAGEGSLRGGTSCVDGVVMVVSLRWRVASIACAALLLSVSLGLGAPRAQAQSTTPTPTAAQMEVFKNLPADQQRMIMQQLQKSGTGKGTQQKKTDTAAVIPATQKELTAAEQQEALARLQEPRLGAGDTHHHRGRDPRAGRGRPRAVDGGGQAQEGSRESAGAVQGHGPDQADGTRNAGDHAREAQGARGRAASRAQPR